MRSLVRPLIAVAAAAALLLGSALPSGAAASVLFSHAVASPGRTTVSDTEMLVQQLRGPVTVVRTRADALSVACNGCQASAVSLHVVLSSGPLAQLRADNRARAENRRCNGCTTTALSYQVVVGGAGRVELSRAGSARLGGLENQLERMSGRSAAADVAARAEAVLAEVQQVLASEVTVTPSGGAAAQGARIASAGPEIRVFRDADVG